MIQITIPNNNNKNNKIPRSKLKKFFAIREIPEIFDFLKDSYNQWKQVGDKYQFLKSLGIFPKNFDDREIILEVGSGFGEYINLLSVVYSNSLCFGIEIKGERLYTAYQQSLSKIRLLGALDSQTVSGFESV